MMASPTLPTVWEVVQALARGRGGARAARVSTSGSSIGPRSGQQAGDSGHWGWHMETLGYSLHSAL